jgi:hypothetical protein
MAALASIRGLPPAAIRVALRLLDHYNCRTGRCNPSVETLAEATGLDSRTVSRAVGRLEALGLFHVTRRPGRHRSNAYKPDFARLIAKIPTISSGFRVEADESAQSPAVRSGNTDSMIPETPVEWPDKTIKETIKKHGEATPSIGAVQGPLQAPVGTNLTNKPESGQHDADTSAERANDSGEAGVGLEAATESKRARIIELNRIWREKVSVLKGSLGKHQYRQWIDPLRAEDDDGQTLTVACPTNFHLDWVNTHFKDRIRDAVGREILLIVSSDCAAAARRKSHPK